MISIKTFLSLHAHSGTFLQHVTAWGCPPIHGRKTSVFWSIRGSLTFGTEFNQGLDGVTLPKSLQSLTFGAEFNRGLDARWHRAPASSGQVGPAGFLLV